MARGRGLVFGRGMPVLVSVFVSAAVVLIPAPILVSRTGVLAGRRGMSAAAGALVAAVVLARAAGLVLG